MCVHMKDLTHTDTTLIPAETVCIMIQRNGSALTLVQPAKSEALLCQKQNL